MEEKIKIDKPFLKWVGGKTQIIDKLIEKFPQKINNYHDIFLGGGSTLFKLLSYVEEGKISVSGKIYAYDLNQDLINVYITVQKKPNELYEKIKEFIDEYKSCPFIKKEKKKGKDEKEEEKEKEKKGEVKEDEMEKKEKKGKKKMEPVTKNDAIVSQEAYYYWVRYMYNNLSQEDRNDIIGSALFIFLNKTCFRGLHRIGPNGFNVPFGNYKNASIIDKNTILASSDLIKNVIFKCVDFEQSITKMKKGDFGYLDPPYALEKSDSFDKYNVDGFSIEKHKKLFSMCNDLMIKKISFMMSNSSVELVLNSFPKDKYEIETVECRRAINSKDPSKTTNEVIIKNLSNTEPTK